MEKPKRIVDIHCHIMYGVDDGAGDIAEAVAMLEIACREGITDIILTPHFKEGRRNAGPERIEERWALLKEQTAALGIPIELYKGNEFFYCSNMEELLERKQFLTLNDSDYVLVEFSPDEDFVYLRNGLDNCLGLGYIPVLAHAERYECMVKNIGYIREIHDMGVRIQVNASGICGDVGGKLKKHLHRLLKERMVDYVGTDAHGSQERKPEMKRCCEYLYKKYERSYVDDILFRNAEEIISKIK